QGRPPHPPIPPAP
uniref:Bradykinin-potentiating peptide 13c n=2 Tax=Bothrops jararaca TaxID=8724 RepID=BPPDC_BOTJA|nr:RecName: Full=Bradykinin-potentiating peptide 13c; Short=BPP-13c [Bothrops jararaca]